MRNGGCDDQMLFPRLKATDKNLFTSLTKIWKQAHRFLLFQKFNLGLCFFGPDEGLRLFLLGTGGPRFQHRARKLDNLAAGRGSDGKFTALFSFSPLTNPIHAELLTERFNEKSTLCCQKKGRVGFFYVEYMQISQYSESFRDVSGWLCD